MPLGQINTLAGAKSGLQVLAIDLEYSLTLATGNSPKSIFITTTEPGVKCWASIIFIESSVNVISVR